MLWMPWSPVEAARRLQCEEGCAMWALVEMSLMLQVRHLRGVAGGRICLVWGRSRSPTGWAPCDRGGLHMGAVGGG